MSSANTEQVMPVKPAQALANPLFPALDNVLRSGRHVGLDELDNHAFLMDFQEHLEEFYVRYNVKLIRVPKEFFYLCPCSTTLIPRSISSELNMMVGKVLYYFYLDPEWLASERIFTQQELCDELFTLVDETKLLRLVNNRSAGSDVDRQELQEKVCSSLSRLCRLDVVWFMGYDSGRSCITELVFRFGVNVRAGNGPREAQRHPIRDGKTMPIEDHLQLNDETEESQPDSGGEG